MAGAPRLVRVVADLRATLFAAQGFDGGVDIEDSRGAQCGLHARQELRREPRLALLSAHTRQRATQCVFADDFFHSQNLRAHRVSSQTGDVSIAVMPGQYS